MMSLLNLVSMMAALATSACALSSSLTVQTPAPVVVDASELFQEQTLLYHWFHEASGIAVLDGAGTTLNRISSGAAIVEGSNPPAYLVSEGKNPSSFRPMHPHSSPVPPKHRGALVARDLRTNDELWRIEVGADVWGPRRIPRRQLLSANEMGARCRGPSRADQVLGLR
ncbi:MAG: hypothetical protein RBU37_23805 [Myxococcota bacterium]|jgi:hypothetical protein|nr:hypothetical protein [Myxococcota bacterium]